MPPLEPTPVTGTVTWLGVVPARDLALSSAARPGLELNFAGADGEDHGGLTRPSCTRVRAQYRIGTEIRTTRQLSVVSAEELEQIRSEMGIDRFDPSWIGASLVLSGIPDPTFLPPSSRLQFTGGATITVDMENRPCNLPAAVIEVDCPGRGRSFKAAAKDRRGITAWVEREGSVRLGDTVTLHVPAQRSWRGEPNGQ